MNPDQRTGGDGKGFYIRTFTGKQFHLDDVEHHDYDIRDIAHALSLNCRWTGHTKEFYSVAEHCFYASYEVPQEHALAALLHDASEAYIHDTPSPLKWYLAEKGFRAFDELEKRIDQAIMKYFHVPWPRDPCVKDVDLRLLATENRDLMPEGEERMYMLEPYRWRIMPVSPIVAEHKYLARFNQLNRKDW